MNYIHNPYPFPGHAAVPLDQPVGFDPAMVHPSMVHPIDGYLYPHPPFDMVDFYPQPIMDYEEYAENLSRPRLTKEQVETLEAQFQAHPKPSSNVKRQLAAQTNLSLPRVANWFQNRRAKAKQQKRQEEFERMQKAKAEAEEAARGKTESIDHASESSQNKTPTEETDKTSTPRPSSSVTVSADRTKTPAHSSSSRSKHKKTRSESAREATFASLQRALNAAVAARERYGDEAAPQGANDMDASVSPTNSATTFPTAGKSDAYNDSHTGQSTLNTPFTEWESARTSSVSWASSQSPQEPFGYSGLNANSFPAQGIDSPHQQDAQYSPRGTEWPSQVSSAESRAASDADASYNAMQYTLQSDVPLSRRGSSDELADTLEGIGIDTTGTSHDMSHLAHQGDRLSWKEAGKELDLAARRKRPRPAAIGTSRSSSMLAGSMSPTTRMPGHGVRQTKSAQSLNSRYAGVRKASAAQRSPLNFSTFAEAGALNSTKAEMSTMLQPTVSTSLAPPTPLTPEDFQHLLPTSPTDGYCLSAQPNAQFFPTTQPMQINIASPPATPMAVDMMSSYQYQNVPPPMSAPAHYTSFPEYTTCDTAPLTARSWADAPTIPSPDASFQSSCQISQTDVTSMPYDPTDQSGQSADGSIAGSPSMVYQTKDTGMSASADAKPTEFLIHEFPEQQEAHRFVAQQLPSQKPKHYTFVDQSGLK